jgi:hypothetical protein
MPTLARLALSSRSDSNNRAVGRRGWNQFLSEIPTDKSSLLQHGLAPSPDRCQRGVKAATQGSPFALNPAQRLKPDRKRRDQSRIQRRCFRMHGLLGGAPRAREGCAFGANRNCPRAIEVNRPYL